MSVNVKFENGFVGVVSDKVADILEKKKQARRVLSKPAPPIKQEEADKGAK